MSNIKSYKDLIVWQKSIELVKEIYKLTSLFPKEQLFGIVSQLRGGVVSVRLNIAEGYARRSHKEYLQFYSVSYGSALELETQLIISQELQFTDKERFFLTYSLLQAVVDMLYVMGYREKGGIISV